MSNNPQNSESDSNGTEKHPPSENGSLEQVIVDEHGQPYIHKSNPYQELKDRSRIIFNCIPHGDKMSIVLTGIIALSTVGQLVVSCNNNKSTTKQVNNLIDSANRIDGAADRFAISASRIDDGIQGAVSKLNLQADRVEAARISSVEQSQKVLEATVAQNRLDQRAWVAVIDIIGPPVKDTPWKIAVRAQNTGRTFAKHFRMSVAISPELADFAIVEASQNGTTRHSVSLISPQGMYTSTSLFTGIDSIPLRTNPTESDILSIQTGKINLYAFGKIWYDDIFGVHHWTTFCAHIKSKLSMGLLSHR